MNTRDLIETIKSTTTKRDKLLDELNDIIEHRNFSETELAEIIDNLSNAIDKNCDADEQESFFNILSSIYLSGPCQRKIENIILARLHTLRTDSLTHAIEMIACSNIPERWEILKELSKQQPEPIRKLIQSNLPK
jgi:hypothetical protein